MTRDSSPYFRSASEAAPFDPERMGSIDLLSSSSLSIGVNALEPGQRYEPRPSEHADKVHAVLEGRGAFVVGDSRQILGPGDLALAPAGTEHRAFANQGERLVLLVVANRPAARVDSGPANPEPRARPAAPAGLEPVHLDRRDRPARTLPGLTVPLTTEPADAPPELPVTRSTVLSTRTPAQVGPAVLRSTSGLSGLLNTLRALREAPSDESPPVIPESRRCSPVSSRVRAASAAPSSGPAPVIAPTAPAQLRTCVPMTSGASETPPARPRTSVPMASAPSGTRPDTSWLPEIFRKSASKVVATIP